MSICTNRSCKATAVLQWQRTGTSDETAAHVATLNAQRAGHVEEQRDRVREAIHELQFRLTVIPPAPELGDNEFPSPVDKANEAMRAQYGARLVEEQARLDKLTDPTPITVDSLGPVTVAVFGCEQHALDLDSAAVLHDAGCLAPDDPCACTP